MFSCFSQVYTAVKNNIFGIEESEEQQLEAMQGGNYKIEKKGTKGEHLYLIPKGEHTHTLIFMHGLGDTANGYLDIFNSPMNPVSPTTKVVLLTAPIRKVTVNFQMQMTSWFDFKDFEVTNQNFKNVIGVDEIIDSAKTINYVLQEEVATLKNKSENVMIGGFSQGACMALHAGLQFDQPLGGIFVFSGFAFPITQPHEKNQKIKMMISHGKDDVLLPWKRCELSYKECLNTNNHEIRWEIFEGLQHGFNEESFRVFKDQFQKIAK